MTTETQVSTGEETQIQAPVVTNELSEVVTEQVEGEAPEVNTEDEAERAQKRMQRRIDKRTADYHRERAQRERLERQVAELTAPKKESDPTDPKHIEDAVRTHAKEIARVERVNEKCNAIAAEGKKAFNDFDDALKSLSTEVTLFNEKGPTPLMEAILEFDAPAKLLHHLGKNPDLAAELDELTPTQAARRLDRIEREMSAKPKTSSAPAPLTPVRGNAGGSKDLADLSDKDFAKRRREQIANRR